MSELKAQAAQRAKENRDPRGLLNGSGQFDGGLTRSGDHTYMGVNLDSLPPYLSQMIINPGAGQDIMNMGMDELEGLKQ